MAAGKWKENLLAITPNFDAGIVENVEEILEMHNVAKQVCLGTRSSVKKTDSKETGKVHKDLFIGLKFAELFNIIISIHSLHFHLNLCITLPLHFFCFYH